MTRVHILLGDVRARLAELPAASVHCVVTSPPYWGLRSYLPEGSKLKPLELGSEETPETWAEVQVEVFRQVRRVLRADGCLWLNLGDCYSMQSTHVGKTKLGPMDSKASTKQKRGSWSHPTAGYKGGDRVQLGPMLSEALRRDGWYLRQTIVWAKGWSFGRFRDETQGLLWDEPELLETDDAGAVMPGSVNGWRWERHRVKIAPRPRAKEGTYGGEFEHGLSRQAGCREEGALTATYRDCPGCPKCEDNDGLVLRKGTWRPTDAFEYLYLLTKTASYYGDQEAVAEGSTNRASGNKVAKLGDEYGRPGYHRAASIPYQPNGSRNLRNVWRVATKGYRGSHYATFPLDLVVPCIKASTSERGVCPECGAPWVRLIHTARSRESGSGKSGRAPTGKQPDALQGGGGTGDVRNGPTVTTSTLGWRPSCSHKAEPAPATVLDPYGGSGTVGEACAGLGRDCILIDLDPRNEKLMRRRLRSVALVAEVSVE